MAETPFPRRHRPRIRRSESRLPRSFLFRKCDAVPIRRRWLWQLRQRNRIADGWRKQSLARFTAKPYTMSSPARRGVAQSSSACAQSATGDERPEGHPGKPPSPRRIGRARHVALATGARVACSAGCRLARGRRPAGGGHCGWPLRAICWQCRSPHARFTSRSGSSSWRTDPRLLLDPRSDGEDFRRGKIRHFRWLTRGKKRRRLMGAAAARGPFASISS